MAKHIYEILEATGKVNLIHVTVDRDFELNEPDILRQTQHGKLNILLVEGDVDSFGEDVTRVIDLGYRLKIMAERNHMILFRNYSLLTTFEWVDLPNVVETWYAGFVDISGIYPKLDSPYGDDDVRPYLQLDRMYYEIFKPRDGESLKMIDLLDSFEFPNPLGLCITQPIYVGLMSIYAHNLHRYRRDVRVAIAREHFLLLAKRYAGDSFSIVATSATLNSYILGEFE